MRQICYLILSAIAITGVCAAIYFVLFALATDGSVQMLAHRATLVCFVLATLCIETRVRMGYRLVHDILFYIHLSAAIPFFLVLGMLAFIPLPIWFSYINLLLFSITLSTGALLFSGGVRKYMRF